MFGYAIDVFLPSFLCLFWPQQPDSDFGPLCCYRRNRSKLRSVRQTDGVNTFAEKEKRLKIVFGNLLSAAQRPTGLRRYSIAVTLDCC